MRVIDASAEASGGHGAVAWTCRKILESAADNMIVTERLMRVANLIDPPKRLIAPGLLARVAAHHIKRGLTGRSDTPVTQL